MTKAQDPYSRVYWRAIDDDKFIGIWDDDAALSAWLRLLLAADMAYPATASLYHGVKKGALDRLCKAGLVDIQPGHRYRIHGLDAERSKRSKQGSLGAAARWDDGPGEDPEGDAEGMLTGPPQEPVSNAEGMPRRDKRRQEETEPRRDEPRTNGVLPLRGSVAGAQVSTLGTPSERRKPA